MAGQQLQFEHFEIATDELGSPVRLGPGGMGTTFKAYDTRLRKSVALKIINEPLLADASSRRRFFNEARAAALIDHPNVARVLYLCPEQADKCFFAMELVEGESLASRVARYGPLPPGEALLLLRAVADALGALGEHRLVHRDIKPDNIMIARAGKHAARVTLIDFGLAKALEHKPERFDSVHTGERFVGSV
ncbi:MAG TPA: serine/threonine-protein kinase, partial [Chthoniobacteraceae bacterium]|nr:serine/threonine-protein kinase [Chthoniobacteraceae bacterium]